MTRSELDQVHERYARRKAGGLQSRYDPLMAVNLCFRQEKERALSGLLNRWLRGRELAKVDIVEIGCGSGDNLLQLIQLGADPGRIVANELLADRIAVARRRLPASVTMIPGDASSLDLPDGTVDLVLQSTVFSSVLDRGVREAIAQRAWRLLRPGGVFLWYDFTYDNPRNPDVRGVQYQEMRGLFPNASEIVARRITLAPPLARRLAPVSRQLYNFASSLRLLNTHLLATITKPHGGLSS